MSKTMVLAVIGGGSSQWMISLMKDVYLLDAVDGGEIRLVDPDRGGAEAVACMLARFNAMRGKDYRVSVCDDRAEALGGADFVMTTFSPGSMDAFEYDLEIPIRYGIRQPVSMTVGPAGISAARDPHRRQHHRRSCNRTTGDRSRTFQPDAIVETLATVTGEEIRPERCGESSPARWDRSAVSPVRAVNYS